MSQIEIYVDEDAMDSDFVAPLRSRGVSVITALDVGLAGRSDDEQLALAAEHGLCPLHVQCGGFLRLHTEWADAGRQHAGMIPAPQQRFSVGEQLRRILRLRAATAAASMRNHVEFLGNWG